MFGRGGTTLVCTNCASTPIGTTTVARGRGFRRSAVQTMKQQMHNSKNTGNVKQMRMTNVPAGSDVPVAFMSYS